MEVIHNGVDLSPYRDVAQTAQTLATNCQFLPMPLSLSKLRGWTT